MDNIIKTINNKNIKTNFFEDICKEKYNSVILEKLKNTTSFYDLLENNNTRSSFYNLSESNVTYDIFPDYIKKYEKDFNNCVMDFYGILIQIYATLNINNNNFTHQDLNLNNILLMKDPSKKKFTFIYNYKNKKIKIYTNYIAVIIDYGRSYVKCKNASTNIFKKNAYNSTSCIDKNIKTITTLPIIDSKINFAQYNVNYTDSLDIEHQYDLSKENIDSNEHRIDNRCIFLFKENIYKNTNRRTFKNEIVKNFLNKIIVNTIKFKNIPETLDWLIECVKDLKNEKSLQEEYVDFNINIDMDDNKDWYIDFL